MSESPDTKKRKSLEKMDHVWEKQEWCDDPKCGPLVRAIRRSIFNATRLESPTGKGVHLRFSNGYLEGEKIFFTPFKWNQGEKNCQILKAEHVATIYSQDKLHPFNVELVTFSLLCAEYRLLMKKAAEQMEGRASADEVRKVEMKTRDGSIIDILPVIATIVDDEENSCLYAQDVYDVVEVMCAFSANLPVVDIKKWKLVQEYDGRKDLEELTGDWDDRNKDSAKIFTALCLKTNQWFEDNIENRKKRGK